jgi:hypothetical protein
MSFRSGIILLSALAVLAGLSLAGCPTQTPTVTGSATDSQTEFTEICQGCHTAIAIKANANLITSAMGTLSPAMSGIVFTDQEVADLKAFRATQ